MEPNVSSLPTERNRDALALFAPIAETYDRYGALLSLGQDERWRSFLVSRVGVGRNDTVLDVACGTGAVALDLVRRYGCNVVAVDQSAEMLAEARRRVDRAGEPGRIVLRQARAESLPFEAGAFDALTFTYLLRYVDAPGATLRELARVVRRGGRIAGLEFFVPSRTVARLGWDAYVRGVLPVAGRALSPGWGEVGRFLGPSIRAFWERYPLGAVLGLWRAAGIRNVEARMLMLGAAVVISGERGD